MARVARIIGGAGTGKTTRLMGIVEKLIHRGYDPMEIGFVSFTRAARAEAAERVQAQFGADAKALQQSGWFRTLHSVCYQALGSRKVSLIADRKEAREWLSNALDVDGAKVLGGVMPADVRSVDDENAGKSPRDITVSAALSIWSTARNRLGSIDEEYRHRKMSGDVEATRDQVFDVVRQYERAKELDGWMDFADLAGRFSGWKWVVDDVPEMTQPRGDAPSLPVWFFDEHQDVSQLLHSCAYRLEKTPGCEFVYYAGDPFQSLFGFAGSDSRCLMELVDPEPEYDEIMKRSYRCPRGVLERGERVLKKCTDYFDRGIEPNSDECGVDETNELQSTLDRFTSDESWLFIARTNRLARKFYSSLNNRNIPWDYTHAEGGYLPPTDRKAASIFLHLEQGRGITPDEWKMIVQKTPARSGETVNLKRGTKSKADGDARPGGVIGLDNLTDHGWTPEAVDLIRRGQWKKWVNNSQRYVDAVKRFGFQDAIAPKVRVGTIHSVKGSEADRVVMLTTLSQRCYNAMGQNSLDKDAEHRVSYVGMTRARKQLTILSQRKDRYWMEL